MAKKILVIDDEVAIAQLIRLYLEDRGYEVQTVLSGTEALSKIQEFKPDIITLDIMMPELNGFQLLELLKSKPETASIPVILVSVVEGPQKERGFRLGAVDFVPKPIEPDELFDAISKVEGQLSGIPGARKKAILVVDDEPDAARLLKEYLQQRELEVMVVDNGPDAVAFARKERPGLIVLDLVMPEMDGFAVLKVLKKDPVTESIPIIVLTAHDMKGYREKCLMLGASQYLTKPFSGEVLAGEIEKEIKKIEEK